MIIKEGLTQLERDERDFSLGSLFQLPKLEELPKEYFVTPLSIKDQNADNNFDFCAGCAGTGMIEPKEEVELFYPYLWSAAKYESGGDINSFGVDIRSVGKALCKWGVPEIKDVPDYVKNLLVSQRRDFKLYKYELQEKAKKHQAQTYMFLDGKYDAYDNARAIIWKFRDEKRLVIFGTQWDWDIADFELKNIPNSGYGHCMYVNGWYEDGLSVVNSVGIGAGKNGTHKMSREVFNKGTSIYGAFVIVDKPKETVQYMIDNKIKEGDSWLTQILKVIWTIFASPLLTLKEKAQTIRDATKTMNEIADKIAPEATKSPTNDVPMQKYDWSTPTTARHSCRIIMDEYNLKWAEKNLLCAVIMQESGFKNTAVCENKNSKGEVTSIDVGICQINSWWHTGTGKTFPSVEYVVAHPDEAVRFMIKMYKQGKLNLWVAYKSGAYKRYL